MLASFSGRDDTGGNSLSTTDNDRTELYMKDAIDVSSLVQITCTPKRVHVISKAAKEMDQTNELYQVRRQWSGPTCF